MKKRLIALLMAAALFSGCGGGSASPSEPASVPEPLPEEAESIPESVEELPLTLRLTVPEGYTLARIGMTLEEMGVCTAEEFIDAAESGDYSGYSLIAAQEPNENRCFALEGYLFPDTYEIYRTESPGQIIRRMLDHGDRMVGDDLREQIALSGYTIDEIVTMASIIEKEAFGEEVMPLISSVLHNRINVGMQLQCDVTIVYVVGAIQPFIEGDQNRYNDYYNTYTCRALPAGAICNPGLPALRAALNPAQTDYYYFVTDEEKQYYFSETWEEHEQAVSQAGLS